MAGMRRRSAPTRPLDHKNLQGARATDPRDNVCTGGCEIGPSLSAERHGLTRFRTICNRWAALRLGSSGTKTSHPGVKEPSTPGWKIVIVRFFLLMAHMASLRSRTAATRATTATSGRKRPCPSQMSGNAAAESVTIKIVYKPAHEVFREPRL